MAYGVTSDVVIYQEEFNTAVSEVIAQETMAFNQASGNAMQLRGLAHQGDYLKESFFDLISGLVARRDNTSTSTVSDTALTASEQVGVKLNRGIPPVAVTLDAWKKMMRDPGEFSFVLGQQIGKAIVTDYLNTAIRATVAALNNVANLKADVTGASTGTLTHEHLVTGMSKLGDRGATVAAIVTHSKSYFDLVKTALTTAAYNVGDTIVYTGGIATLGRPTIVTDSADLITSGSPDNYNTLLLVPGAVEILESEERTIVNQTITGYANLFERIQGEHAFTLKLKGFTWDVGNGGANPNDSAISTGSNWDKVVTSDKDCAGAVVVSL